MGDTLAERVRAILDEQKIRPADLVKVADVSKGLVSQWMNDQRGSMGYEAAQKINRRYHYAIDWLMTGHPPKLEPTSTAVVRAGPSPAYGGLTPQEEDLLARYRAADPRWQLALRLLAALGTEDQIAFASDVNVIVARLLGKKPADVRYASNERVAAAFGTAPHVAARQKERNKR